MHQQQPNNPKQQQQQRTYPLPPKLNRPASVLLEPSTVYHAQEIVTRPRSQSQAVYSTYVPPPNTSQSSIGNSNGNSGSGISNSSINSGLDPGSSNDLQPRLQNWRPPAHKSKLSKQYTPSEDSDEESTGGKAGARRRSKYMSGAALELNTGPRKEEYRGKYKYNQLYLRLTMPCASIWNPRNQQHIHPSLFKNCLRSLARAQSNGSQTSVLDDSDAASLSSLRSTTKKCK
ncbi:MAG: hypothetical protein JOS17DRAFT_277483 [Linnemannia elongata]|nr:MAG: hypothetical protein JOS17DRAFT_277483 [Linnemannia elongata]